MIQAFAGRKGRRLAISFLIFFGIMISLHSCMTFRMSNKEIDQFFVKHKIDGTRNTYKSEGKTIHYVEAGAKDKPLILFVHGSPGSLSAFIHFLSDSLLTSQALVVSTDRPGFGHSSFGTGEPSLAKQSATLKPILEKYSHNKPVILVGHSLGGPLIVKMAIDYPELVDGLVIVAGSVDPDLEPKEGWFRVPLASPFLRWILPRSFRASNDEIVGLRWELNEMLPDWKNVTCPVIVIQGSKDQLVPPANADFAKQMLVNAPVEIVRLEGVNHFIPWSHPEVIKSSVLKLLLQDIHFQTAGN